MQEAHTNTIDLSDDSEYTIAAMVNFMYYGKYDAAQILPSEDYDGGVAMLLHVRVVSLAQKYFVEPLQKYAGDLACKQMKQWDGASSIFAETVFAIYTSTGDVSFGTTLRERAVEVVMDRALLLFGPDNEHLSGTRDILLHETPGFVEDWARAMSHCKDTLSIVNTNLEAVNDALNDDNVKLDTRRKGLEGESDRLRAAALKIQEDSTKTRQDLKDITDQNKNLELKLENAMSMPDRPTANTSYAPTGPAPDCYKCPNCELLFFRVILVNGSYHHPCFDYGWCGKLGKGSIKLWWQEWQQHLVRKG